MVWDKNKPFPKRASFSWSKSRAETFNRCQREYYYNYYGYWPGWNISAPLKVRSTYFLKNLVPIDALVGVAVHEAIKDYLIRFKNTGEDVFFSKMLSTAESYWIKVIENTKSKKWRNTKRTVGILEYNYREVDDKEILDAIEKTKLCLQNFYTYFRQLHIKPEDILFIDDEEAGFIELTYEGVSFRLYAVVDLLYKTSNGIVITDWKTGLGTAEEDVRLQLTTYGLWAQEVLGIKDLESIEFRVVKLFQNQTLTLKYPKEMFETMENQIMQSIKDTFVYDKFHLNEDMFKLTDNIDKCKFCKFKEVCPRFKKG